MFQRIRLSTALGLALLAGAPSARSHTPADSGATRLDAVQVTATDIFRNRLSTPAPVLSYDYRYFQRFEPLTVGDMLKRIPGLSFSSDVLEYDYVQLRGIGAQYTQILINGRRLPGGAGNRSIQVDRIPAEMVERIELIRSPTAAMGSEGVAGTLNIILKKGATYAGGSWRLGAQHFENGKIRGSGFASIGGTHENMSFSLALDVQQRYNPKRKEEFHYTPARELAFNEFETDTRDGTDASLSGGINVYLDDGGQWSLNAPITWTPTATRSSTRIASLPTPARLASSKARPRNPGKLSSAATNTNPSRKKRTPSTPACNNLWAMIMT